MKKLVLIKTALFLLVACCMTGGCLATKTVTVPMRVTGAAVSAVPVAGNTVHDVIDEAADTVDKAPF
jgi:hypothetical protein